MEEKPGTLAAHGFPDTEFGNAMLKRMKAVSAYYKEYVTQDHGHKHVARLTTSMALAMIELSPYRPFLGWYVAGTDESEGPIQRLMNKGAVRITIAPEHAELPCWTEEQLESDVCRNRRDDLWVYNHDGRYYLTRPS